MATPLLRRADAPSPHGLLRAGPTRRGWLLGSAAALLAGPGAARPPDVLRLGVPNDVADDLVRFLQQRDVASVTHFGGVAARRDVMELAYLLREIARQPQAPRVQLQRIDSYGRLLLELAGQGLDALGTSAWGADLDTQGDAVRASAAVLPRGSFVVGIYTSTGNEAARGARTLAQLRSLRFVCNSAWALDWRTLQQLGITPLFDVKTWPQMVELVARGRADAVLAPFQPNADLSLQALGFTLVPIEGLAVALDGSRHFAASRTAGGRWLAAEVFPVVARHARDGTLRRAYEECGFFPQRTRGWTVLVAG